MTGLPANPTVQQRAVSADSAGNAYVVDQLTTGPVVLNRLTSGATTFAVQHTVAATGTDPGVKALPNNQALVVYTSGTSVYATIHQY